MQNFGAATSEGTFEEFDIHLPHPHLSAPSPADEALMPLSLQSAFQLHTVAGKVKFKSKKKTKKTPKTVN